MHRSKPLAVAALLVSAATVALSGCTSPQAGTADAQRSMLTLAVPRDLGSWDPAKMLGAGTDQWYEEAVYDRLFNCDAAGKPSGSVAQSWKINANDTRFEFTIRPGQKFSDGTPLTANDVKASIDHSTKGSSSFVGISTKVANDGTVVVTFPKPNHLAMFMWCSPSSAIISAKHIAARDFGPYGTGPYVYNAAQSTPGSSYVFEKNESNWDSKSFPFQKVVLKVIASPTATLNALKTGEIDGAVTDASAEPQIKASGLRQETLSGEWAGLIISDRNGKVVPALANVDVRRAINMVFDKKAIATKLYNGLVQPRHQIFRDGSGAWIPDLKDPYPYDVAKAKQLMAGAGYADGFNIEMPAVAGYGWGPELPFAVQQLGLLNIHVKTVTLSGPNAIGDLVSGRFPIVFWPLGNSPDSVVDINGDIAPTGVWNTQKATDPEVTRLLNEINIANAAELPSLEQALNRYVIKQAWFAPWVNAVHFFAYRNGAVTVPRVTDPNELAPSLRDLKR